MKVNPVTPLQLAGMAHEVEDFLVILKGYSEHKLMSQLN